MSVDTITYCNIKYQNLGHYYIYIVYLKAVKYIIHSDFYLYIYSFAGGPGSGRGTQCEKLVLKHKFKHLSSGDLLRHEVMSGSQRGGNLYKLMSTGEPVPNGIVNDLIAEAMVKFADGNDVCSKCLDITCILLIN